MTDYITGSNGFIGKHLMARLNSHAVAIPHEQLTDCTFENCKSFYFLSAYGNLADHTDVLEIHRANIYQLGYVVCEFMANGLPCESFVYVSSSSVTLPVQTPYSRTKRAAEEILLASPLPACIVRPYSVIGRGEQPQHLIPTLIRSCMTGEPMILVPDATHDFIDVDDVVNGMLHLASNGATGVFEFGSGKPTTNVEVLRLVEEACGRSANIAKVTRLRAYDSPDWYCRNPGWLAIKSLESSIAEMVEAYRNEHD